MASRPEFFPSLHDLHSCIADTWRTLFSQHSSAPDTHFEPHPWPADTSALAASEYEPLDEFAPPAGPADTWSEHDAFCELAIRLKEMELLHLLLGEYFDSTRYNFLKSVFCETRKQMLGTK